jgi:predicted Zn-dependent protease
MNITALFWAEPQLVQSKYGRDAELESDFYGMNYMAKAGYDPRGAIDLQKTFLRLSENKQNDIINGL